jgi:hypothetical protein
MNVIASDPGFGNYKVAARNLAGALRTAVIQTAVTRPQAIGQAASGLRTAALREVTFDDGQRFAVGPGAWHWGETISSMDYSALASPERKALFYAAIAEILPAGEYEIDLLVIGLPVALMADSAQMEAVSEGLRSYKLLHEFCIGDGMPYRFSIKAIKALAQPVGAYGDWMIDDELRVRKATKDLEAGVLDIGRNTLDMYVLQGGVVAPRYVHGEKLGVRRLLASLDDQGLDEAELDAALRSGKIRPSQSDMDAWMGQVMGFVEKKWSSLRRFACIIPTGGGSLLLGDALKHELTRRGATVCWPNDPVTANVRGLWKWYARGGK